MTELMKRYEAETGKKARDELYSGSIKLYMPTNDYIAWLEAQLTWRPVSEKPEKEGRYWVMCLWQEEDEIFYCSIEYALKKGWVADKNITVLYWLPIPPAPEGE